VGGFGSCWFKLLQMQRWFYIVCKEPYPAKGRNWLLFQNSNMRLETCSGVQVELDVFSVQNMKTILIVAIPSFHIKG